MEAVLFPLPGLILSPGGKITLNIFEPRYLKMVQDALDRDLPMAIGHASKTEFSTSVAIPDEGFPYVCSDVGFGKVEVLGESPKGLFVAVSSLGKAHISHVQGCEDDYIKLQISPIHQNYELSAHSEFLYRRIKSLAADKMMNCLKSKEEVERVMQQLGSPHKLLAFYTDHILKGWDKKYELFQIDDINEKIQRLGQMIVSDNRDTDSSLH